MKCRLLRVLTCLGIYALIFISVSASQSAECPEQTGRFISGEALEKIRETAIYIRQPALAADVHRALFSHLDDQIEYVDRPTQKIESGSNKWKFRWTNMKGDVIYSNLSNYDPNGDKRLSQTKYKKTPAKNGTTHNQ